MTNLPFLAYFGWVLPGDALLWIGLYLLVFFFYSAPPPRFKARPYLDSLSNAAYALPIAIVPLALESGPVWAAAVALMAWSVAKHAFDAVQDIEEDRTAGITTTAVRLGVRGTVLWSGTWWTLATIGFAMVNVPVALLNALISGGLLYILFRSASSSTAHGLYRYSIAFPYVAGAVAGIQLVAALLLGWYP